ncbi:TetR/AcrR family transcriptional regulator [Nocardioides sp. R-C-SC26]|uniref:TetR/AcrR family transcriptional regulator n=1 Tax=Nocardioides sp. R-C-SC26 TaxID=2870414 RepID=UPI001E40D4A8|nr:WHG domain-containing protein [Nocardioides sp. R-C-SC26]
MTQAEAPLSRRERQREATFTEIVAASRALLAQDSELSLRAVAQQMGMTAPALYRYVANYQELVDLVAFEIDKTATALFAAAADAYPAEDPAARLVAAITEFRMWAHTHRREFVLTFANPVADSSCVRRELITSATSGHLMTDLMFEVWADRQFDVPALADLPETVQEAIRTPLMPAKIDRIPEESRGLAWAYIQGWTALYGVVALEVMGHMDPRLIESGEMFIDVVTRFAPSMGLEGDVPRLVAQMRERIRAQSG